MVEYSNNMMFECLCAGDTNITITGYIDLIIGRKWLKDKKQAALIFRLNNTRGKQIDVYIWGPEIPLFESRIAIHKNVTITRGSIKVTSKASVTRSAESTLAFHSETFSQIFCHGTYNPQIRDSLIYTEVTLNTIAAFRGPVVLESFIKDRFLPYTFGGKGCMNGSVSDGAYRLTVHIIQYDPVAPLTTGIRVKLWGTLEANGFGGCHLKVVDMHHVQLLPDHPRMSKEELDEAVISVNWA